MINGNGAVERPAVMDVFTDGEKEKTREMAAEKASPQKEEKEKEAEKKEAERRDKEKQEGKKSRRNTLTGLTVMVNPINSIRANIGRKREPSTTTSTSPPTQLAPPAVPAPPHTGSADKNFDNSDGGGMKASTSKARKVMQWIRKGRDSIGVAGPTGSVPSPAGSVSTNDTGDATSPVQVFVTTPGSGVTAPASLSPIVTKTLAGGARKGSDATSPASAVTPTTATTASVTPSFASRFRRSVNIGGASSSSGTTKHREVAPPPTGAAVLRIHHGAVDTGTITTGQPPEVMRHVKEVLGGMGLEIFVESEFKYRCIRAKQRRTGKSTIGSTTGVPGVAAFTMAGSAASNGVRICSFFVDFVVEGMLMLWM
jgi:protein-serine/threonine kinase